MAKRKKSARSQACDDFHAVIIGAGLPVPTRELRFARSIMGPNGRPRQWRFDFAWPEVAIAVEIEGASGMTRPCPRCATPVRVGGRHHTAEGFAEDCRKYNAAYRLGWTVLRFPSKWVRNGEALRELRDTFEALTEDVEEGDGE